MGPLLRAEAARQDVSAPRAQAGRAAAAAAGEGGCQRCGSWPAGSAAAAVHLEGDRGEAAQAHELADVHQHRQRAGRNHHHQRSCEWVGGWVVGRRLGGRRGAGSTAGAQAARRRPPCRASGREGQQAGEHGMSRQGADATQTHTLTGAPLVREHPVGGNELVQEGPHQQQRPGLRGRRGGPGRGRWAHGRKPPAAARSLAATGRQRRGGSDGAAHLGGRGVGQQLVRRQLVLLLHGAHKNLLQAAGHDADRRDDHAAKGDVQLQVLHCGRGEGRQARMASAAHPVRCSCAASLSVPATSF